MWDLIVSVPDICLSFYYLCKHYPISRKPIYVYFEVTTYEKYLESPSKSNSTYFYAE